MAALIEFDLVEKNFQHKIVRVCYDETHFYFILILNISNSRRIVELLLTASLDFIFYEFIIFLTKPSEIAYPFINVLLFYILLCNLKFPI